MILHLDASSPTPAYEQIRAQLAALIDAGELTPGDRLPPIRQLAGDLGLATNTVQRAYRELEFAGVVEPRGRHGTVVREPPEGREPTDAELRGAAESLVRRAHAAGADLEATLGSVRAAFVRLHPPRPEEAPA